MILTFLAYFRERMRPAVFGPVVLLLAFAACWSAHALNLSGFACALILMTLIVTQFRLWDDLADRERDRVTHPDRVLVRAKPISFQLLTVALAAAGLGAAWFFGGSRPFLALASLDAVFAVLYALVRPHLGVTVWQYPVLLSKYPAFATVVALSVGGPTVGRTVGTALLIYGAAQAYEALHSRTASSR